jgi:hypothetical protein
MMILDSFPSWPDDFVASSTPLPHKKKAFVYQSHWLLFCRQDGEDSSKTELSSTFLKNLLFYNFCHCFV